MERLDPLSLCGPKAYFTDFDHRIVQFKEDKEAYRKEIERRLKILLIIKNTVVCAGSHLIHEFAYNFFKDNPFLLTEGIIIPTLRRDLQHITDYLETRAKVGRAKDREIKGPLKEDMKVFYRDHVNKVVEWELMEETTPFKEYVLRNLKDENSVIRRNLPNISRDKINSLISKIEGQELLTRGMVLEEISNWPIKEQKIFTNFVNLIYHMIGARTHKCESALPQENYIDYSITDFFKHRVILSETQVFLKIFFEIAFETLYKNPIPVELLDLLSFEDIKYLRKSLEESQFRQKYDELIQKSLQIINKAETISEDTINGIEKLSELTEQISKTFEEAFSQELPNFLKRRYKEMTKELRKSALSLGISVAGFLPHIGSVATGLDLLQASYEVFINLHQTFKNRKALSDYTLYLKSKERVIHQLIEKYSISEKSTLLDTVDLLVNVILEKIKL
jgi:hypothetical protein